MKTKSSAASSPSTSTHEDIRTSLSVEAIRQAVLDNLKYVQGRFAGVATRNDWYMALAYTIRDRVLQRWMKTIEAYVGKTVKSVSYLSAEFLTGPHLLNTAINLGILDQVRQAVAELGHDLGDLAAVEEEPGLGNGGLGRLAACFLDSLATWKYWRLVTVSAMSSAFSTRSSGMAGRLSLPTSGCAWETPGNPPTRDRL